MKTEIQNTIKKITNWFKVNNNLEQYVYGEYFNGSHNDAENIFLELKKLVNGEHFNHCNYYYKRLNYLINEGIDVTSVQSAAIKKLAEQELNVITKNKKKTKTSTNKKVVTKKKAVKKAYNPKRDRNGRFIARR
jgi:hypothetical protein